MLWQPLPIPILIFAVVSFIFYAVRSGKGRSSSCDCHRPASKNLPRYDRRRVARILEEYSDYTAEVADIISWTPEKVRITIRHAPGDEVFLRARKGSSLPRVVVDGYEIDSFLDMSYTPSRIDKVLAEGIPYKAFIIDRDMAASSPTYKDFLTVAVFYKMDGVPPSHLSL